jgi:hypothetical protein
MPVHINVAGVWKEVTSVHINVGGVWKECDDVPINVAGAWKTGLLHVDPVVTLASINGDTNSRVDNSCYAGQFFGTDGYSEEYSPSGSANSASFQWLTAGNAEDVWVMWTRTGGTLSDWDSLGGGNNNVRLQMNANRAYRIVDTVSSTAGGAETIIGYFRMYDAATGGSLLATSATVTYSARRWHDACPLCCFTPDTPVTLASGLEVPISTVQVGDKIKTLNGTEEVQEILVRTNRPMVRIHFENGQHIDASTDHPFHVKGKGPSAVNPEYEYKDIGVPNTLSVGDLVSNESGGHNTITGLQPIEYPGQVYTFSNKLFYANGKLVY